MLGFTRLRQAAADLDSLLATDDVQIGPAYHLFLAELDRVLTPD